MFGKKEQPAPPPQQTDARLAGPAGKLVDWLLDVGIEGRGVFDSAHKVVTKHLAKTPDKEQAIKEIVGEHLKVAAVGGFVTGLGGFVTLPVALPANVVEFYAVATRMTASIAALRGYDINAREVRSALMLSLIGADSDDLLKKAGYASTGRLANLATQRLPGPVMLAVNKGVGFRLLTQVGKKSFARVGRGVPVVGGVLGAGLDTYLLKQIADHVRDEFPPRDTLQGELHGR